MGLHSPSHAVRVDDGVVTLRDGDTAADRDFVLQWSAVLDGPAAACFIEDRPEGRYALVMLVPDTAAPAAESVTETLFVIDVSGSMQGPSIRQARAALLRAVDRLRPGDRFNILAFNDDSRLFRRGLQPAVPTTLADARGWIGALDADGGTMLHPALLQAARQFLAAGPAPTGIGRRIILITDAAIGNESQLLREAAGGLGDVRLHMVGIGAAPNRFLVRRLAELGGGLSAFVADADAAGGTLDAFLSRIDRPVLRDLRLEWTDDAPRESSPVRLPELFAGQPLLWSGLFPADARVAGRLTGLDDDGAWSCELGRPVEAAGTAARWARLSIDGFMAELHGGGSADSLRARVIDLALAHGLVTEYTSRVAVETTTTGEPPARTCRLPNGLPAGSRLLDALPATGTSRPLLMLLSVLLMGVGGGGLWLLRRRAAVR
jgi:Ca-activated chloride channel family protein